MNNAIKKLFGGIDLTWPKLVAAAVAAGVYTAVMALIPAVRYTSFYTIVVTFEVWVLCGILIIMNSKSNLDSALKCFVFFLISQPLVYLVQVPFSDQGWGLFGYYRYWFIWTVLCLPMGFIGYYMKKGNWLGLLILLPMMLLTAGSYAVYFADFQFSWPRYILITIFCACMLILYPAAIFEDKKTKMTGIAIGALIIVALTAYCLLRPPVYSMILMGNGDEYHFDDTYTASLADEKYGDVEIRYDEGLEDYVMYADLKHAGDTVLTLTAPTGEKTEYDLHIERNTYELTERGAATGGAGQGSAGQAGDGQNGDGKTSSGQTGNGQTGGDASGSGMAGDAADGQGSGSQGSDGQEETKAVGTYTQIDQETAREMMREDDGHVIVDVRTPEEYASRHIPGAILIPNETITDTMPAELSDLDQIILVYCRSGNRSKQAAQKLADMGYTNVYEFGGINTWPGDIEYGPTGPAPEGTDAAGTGAPSGTSDASSEPVAATVSFRSFAGGGHEYTVKCDPEIATVHVVFDYGSEAGEVIDGASYDTIFTFQGVKPGTTEVFLWGRSPILENDDHVYTLTVDEALNTTLEPVRRVAGLYLYRYGEMAYDTYRVTMEPDGYYLSVSDEPGEPFPDESAAALMEIIDKYDVQSWDGFSEYNEYVLDGEGFQLEIWLTDGTHIQASGENKFPENYAYAMGSIWDILTEAAGVE